MVNDPIVEEVRRHRDELASRFDYDVEAIFADMRKRQADVGDRLVRRVGTEERATANVSAAPLSVSQTPVHPIPATE